MLNIRDSSRYLSVPSSTLTQWARHSVIHSIIPEKRGWPTLPFIAVVEAFVLRQLREVGFSKKQIVEAAQGMREEFGDEYGLARPGIGHDQGVEIFVQIGGELYRARDRQQAIRDTVRGFRECIQWRGDDPQRLRLAQVGDVWLDPRFGWGQPTLAESQVPVQSVINLWYAGETLRTIAAEFDLDESQVDSLVRSWSRLNERYATAA